MKPVTLLSLACLWWGVGAELPRVEACTCGDVPPLQARDSSVAVFEGTVVDRRLTLRSEVLFFGWFPVPVDDIIVGRVWKGVSTKRVSALQQPHVGDLRAERQTHADLATSPRINARR